MNFALIALLTNVMTIPKAELGLLNAVTGRRVILLSPLQMEAISKLIDEGRK